VALVFINGITLFDQKIYGSALAFNPNILKIHTQLTSERHFGKLLYSPYVHRYRKHAQLAFMNIGHIHPHKGYDYPLKQWYAEPMATSRNSWSDPYFDKEAGNIRRG